MNSSQLHIRSAVAEDAKAIIEVHRTAIREKASKDYDQALIEAWAPSEITKEQIEKLERQIKDDEWFTLVAEAENIIFGFGQINPGKNTLGAIYVQKNPYGGVGKQRLDLLIARARQRKTTDIGGRDRTKFSRNKEPVWNVKRYPPMRLM
jgi:hypothetical protein